MCLKVTTFFHFQISSFKQAIYQVPNVKDINDLWATYDTTLTLLLLVVYSNAHQLKVKSCVLILPFYPKLIVLPFFEVSLNCWFIVYDSNTHIYNYLCLSCIK